MITAQNAWTHFAHLDLGIYCQYLQIPHSSIRMEISSGQSFWSPSRCHWVHVQATQGHRVALGKVQTFLIFYYYGGHSAILGGFPWSVPGHTRVSELCREFFDLLAWFCPEVDYEQQSKTLFGQWLVLFETRSCKISFNQIQCSYTVTLVLIKYSALTLLRYFMKRITPLRPYQKFCHYNWT